MSEIELVTTILMVVAAFGTTAWFGWQHWKLKREHFSARDGRDTAIETENAQTNAATKPDAQPDTVTPR